MSLLESAMMARALRLAGNGLYTTRPNPRVGCVLVRNETVVGEGYHERAGEAHAEIHALRAAGAQARGAVAFVTLEPCSHVGRTAPCADAMVQAGVKKVFVAMVDPNPRVAGKGMARLREAGIAVELGLMGEAAAALNPGFISRMSTGRPFMRSKLAASLDGRTAMADGESRWITADAAREDVQRLRARACVILTGSGTVLADDPSLNVRPGILPGELPQDLPQPLRVIVDSRARVSPKAKLFGIPGPVLHVVGPHAKPVAVGEQSVGYERLVLAEIDGRIDLPALLKTLGTREINEVHVEAGATLNGALLKAGLLDELVVYMAPLVLGDDARGLFRLPGLSAMRDRLELKFEDVRAVGDDLRLTLRPAQLP